MSSSPIRFYGLLVRPCIVLQPTIVWLPLPLKSVDVSVRSFDFCSEVTVKQTYANNTPCKLDSEYIFPLDENSAVCGFTCDIDGRRIHGIVKEKSEARKEFNQAKSQGKSTMLLEQKQENVFKISIGNLAPNSSCEITLKYITTLDLQGTANRMVIPAVVAPKYEPHHYYGYHNAADGFNGPSSVTVVPSAHGQLSFFQTMTAQYLGQPMAAPVKPPTTIVAKQQRAEPQKFTMKIEVAMPSEITTIVSESHQSQIKVQIDPVVGVSDANGRLSVPHTATILFGMNADGSAPGEYPESLGSRDFVLTITQKQYLEARAVIEVDPETGSQAVQLAFCPQSLDLMDASSLQVEIIFLIDQSGSMGGAGIAAVKSCLEIFLRSLPVACKFNLVSFGSTYRKLFPHALPYSEISVMAALKYASNISADLGGTEILAPLADCFTSKRSVEYPRQIFLLTDGQVSNTQQLVDLTREHAHHARLFTFGLGSSVDRHLVKTLAAAGRGECEFVSGGSSAEAKQEINAKVMRNLIRAMQPSLMDVRVNWSAVKGDASAASSAPIGFFSNLFGGSSAGSIIQCPETIAPIFPPNREIIYALGARAPVNTTGGDQIVNLVVSGQSNRPSGKGIQGRIEWSIPLNLARPQLGTFIHKLAARARIGEIQNWTQSHNRWKDQKAEVLKLALKYQLLSNYTSFLIVDDRKKKGVHTRPSKKVVATAQVDMFNAFLSSQNNPTLPVNSNGFAFQDINQAASAEPTAMVVDGDDEDGEYEDYESEWFDASYQQQQHVPIIMPSAPFASACFGASSGATFGTLGATLGSAVPCRSGSSRGGSGGGLFGSVQKLSAARSAPPSASFGSPAGFTNTRSKESELTCFGGGINGGSMNDIISRRGGLPSQAQSEKSFDSFCTTDSAVPSKRKASASPTSSSSSSFFSFGAAPPSPAPAAVSTFAQPPPPPTGSSAAILFTVLVQMSCVDGTWNLTQELLSLVHQLDGAINPFSPHAGIAKWSVNSLTAFASSLGLPLKAVGTLIAIWTFQQYFPSRYDEWAMMVGKAKGQLRSALTVEQINDITQQIIAL